MEKCDDPSSRNEWMTGPAAATHAADHAMIERYVAGTASEDEAAALESHYLGCETCQSEVKLAAAIKQGLRDTAAHRSQTKRWMAPAAVLSAAAAIVVVVGLSRTGVSDLRELGQLQSPPAYNSIAVREPSLDSATKIFDRGMKAYSARNFAKAASDLAAARSGGVDSAITTFFLGSSLLMDRKPREAVAEFGRVVSLRDTQYLGEAHYLRAKALLQLGQGTAALSALEQAVKAGPPTADIAAALADSVGRILKR